MSKWPEPVKEKAACTAARRGIADIADAMAMVDGVFYVSYTRCRPMEWNG